MFTFMKKMKALLPKEILRRVERDIMLQIVDSQWKDHLYSLDHLKEGIGLRGYGQRDPLVEYKKESFALFTAMRDRVVVVDGHELLGSATRVHERRAEAREDRGE